MFTSCQLPWRQAPCHGPIGFAANLCGFDAGTELEIDVNNEPRREASENEVDLFQADRFDGRPVPEAGFLLRNLTSIDNNDLDDDDTAVSWNGSSKAASLSLLPRHACQDSPSLHRKVPSLLESHSEDDASMDAVELSRESPVSRRLGVPLPGLVALAQSRSVSNKPGDDNVVVASTPFVEKLEKAELSASRTRKGIHPLTAATPATPAASPATARPPTRDATVERSAEMPTTEVQKEAVGSALGSATKHAEETAAVVLPTLTSLTPSNTTESSSVIAFKHTSFESKHSNIQSPSGIPPVAFKEPVEETKMPSSKDSLNTLLYSSSKLAIEDSSSPIATSLLRKSVTSIGPQSEAQAAIFFGDTTWENMLEEERQHVQETLPKVLASFVSASSAGEIHVVSRDASNRKREKRLFMIYPADGAFALPFSKDADEIEPVAIKSITNMLLGPEINDCLPDLREVEEFDRMLLIELPITRGYLLLEFPSAKLANEAYAALAILQIFGPSMSPSSGPKRQFAHPLPPLSSGPLPKRTKTGLEATSATGQGAIWHTTPDNVMDSESTVSDLKEHKLDASAGADIQTTPVNPAKRQAPRKDGSASIAALSAANGSLPPPTVETPVVDRISTSFLPPPITPPTMPAFEISPRSVKGRDVAIQTAISGATNDGPSLVSIGRDVSQQQQQQEMQQKQRYSGESEAPGVTTWSHRLAMRDAEPQSTTDQKEVSFDKSLPETTRSHIGPRVVPHSPAAEYLLRQAAAQIPEGAQLLPDGTLQILTDGLSTADASDPQRFFYERLLKNVVQGVPPLTTTNSFTQTTVKAALGPGLTNLPPMRIENRSLRRKISAQKRRPECKSVQAVSELSPTVVINPPSTNSPYNFGGPGSSPLKKNKSVHKHETRSPKGIQPSVSHAGSTDYAAPPGYAGFATNVPLRTSAVAVAAGRTPNLPKEKRSRINPNTFTYPQSDDSFQTSTPLTSRGHPAVDSMADPSSPGTRRLAPPVLTQALSPVIFIPGQPTTSPGPWLVPDVSAGQNSSGGAMTPQVLLVTSPVNTLLEADVALLKTQVAELQKRKTKLRSKLSSREPPRAKITSPTDRIPLSPISSALPVLGDSTSVALASRLMEVQALLMAAEQIAGRTPRAIASSPIGKFAATNPVSPFLFESPIKQPGISSSSSPDATVSKKKKTRSTGGKNHQNRTDTSRPVSYIATSPTTEASSPLSKQRVLNFAIISPNHRASVEPSLPITAPGSTSSRSPVIINQRSAGTVNVIGDSISPLHREVSAVQSFSHTPQTGPLYVGPHIRLWEKSRQDENSTPGAQLSLLASNSRTATGDGRLPSWTSRGFSHDDADGSIDNIGTSDISMRLANKWRGHSNVTPPGGLCSPVVNGYYAGKVTEFEKARLLFERGVRSRDDTNGTPSKREPSKMSLPTIGSRFSGYPDSFGDSLDFDDLDSKPTESTPSKQDTSRPSYLGVAEKHGNQPLQTTTVNVMTPRREMTRNELSPRTESASVSKNGSPGRTLDPINDTPFESSSDEDAAQKRRKEILRKYYVKTPLAAEKLKMPNLIE